MSEIDAMRPVIDTDFQYLESIDSTNSYCVREAGKLKSGSVVYAGRQTAGRGRHGRTWISPAGRNLYASILFNRSGITADFVQIPQILSLAIYRAVQLLDIPDVWIKWPNDIFIRNKKLSGILTEAVSVGNHTEAIVVGFGVNVNLEENELRQIDKPATSLCVESGNTFDPRKILSDIVECFEEIYDYAQHTETDFIYESWVAASRLIKRKVTIVTSPDNRVTGVVEGFENDGSIRISFDDGIIKTFLNGDVSLVIQQH